MHNGRAVIGISLVTRHTGMREVAGVSVHVLLLAMALASLAYAWTGSVLLRADHITNICLDLIDVRGTGRTFSAP